MEALTDPEVAWVGATENDAKAAGLEYGTGVSPWAASGRAGWDEGMTKLVLEAGTHRLIDAGLVGPTPVS